MPIPRKYATNDHDASERIYEFAVEEVREMKVPLSDNGWKNYISRKMQIDKKMAERLFDRMIEEGILSHTRIQRKKALYVSDTTPDYRRYMWSGNSVYEKD